MSRDRFKAGISVWDQVSSQEDDPGILGLGYDKSPQGVGLPAEVGGAAERGQEGVAHSDHVHAGVSGIEVGDEVARGMIELIAGDNISIDLDSDDREITINAIDDEDTAGGLILATTRVTEDYTVLTSDYTVFCDTDDEAIAITLPEGAEGQTYRIINCGSSGNDVTVSGDTATELVRNAASQTVSDLEIMILTFNETEYWW